MFVCAGVGADSAGNHTNDESVRIPMTNEMFEHYYRVLCRLFYECPGENQIESIELAEDIYQHTRGWRKDQRTPLEREKTSQHIEQFFDSLCGYFFTLDIDCSASATHFPALTGIQMTRGFDKYVMMRVANTFPSERRLRPMLQPGDSFVYEPVAVSSGGKVFFLFKLPGSSMNFDDFRIGLEVDDSTAELVCYSVQWVDPAVVYGEVEEETEKGLLACPAKIYALCSDAVYRHGKAYADNTTLSEKPVIFRPAMYKLPFFYTDGTFELHVPPGKVKLTLERGFEHEIVTEEFVVEPGEQRKVSLRTRRFLDMKSLGWVSGDTHVHWTKNSWDENEDIDLLAMVQRAEDVRVVNNLTLYQWTPRGPFIKPDAFPMGPVPGYCSDEYHIQMGEEYRNDGFYGHINLLGITDIIEPIATGQGSGGDETALDYPTNKTAIDTCHAQGGIYTEAHGLGPFENGDTAVNAVLGLADGIDQLDAPYYYRLLNVGARVPLGNGSDHPARVLGCARTYVKVDGPFTYSAWLDGIRAGRTFVSSGPLLLLRINGEDIGSQLDVKPGDNLRLELEAYSRYPLGNVQIISNGEVVKSLITQDKHVSIQLEMKADISRWFVARCSPNDEYTIIKTAEDRYTARPHIAHTSAVYVNVEGKPVFFREDAQFWLERFYRHAENIRTRGRFAHDGQRDEAVNHVMKGIRELEARLARHNEGS